MKRPFDYILPQKTLYQVIKDELIYGNAFYIRHTRKKYNPFRYFLGEVKILVINPKEIIITNIS